MNAVRNRRVAFTLVELLVVIAIIGILVALLLPAIQAAREAARRTQCVNNLKQIGLALHNYHDTHNALPAAYIYDSAFKDQPSWGWPVAILPYMEMTTLYDELNPEVVRLNNIFTSSSSAAEKALLQTEIDGYRCPSDVTPKLNNLVAFGPDHFDIGTSNYVSCMGTDWKNYDEVNNGTFYGNSWNKFADILDGTSSTIFIGERAEANYAAVWAGVGTNKGPDNDKTVRCNARTPFGINRDYIALGSPENQGKGFGSYHPGGANFMFGDGAVNFISQDILGSLFNDLGKRSDGNAVVLP